MSHLEAPHRLFDLPYRMSHDFASALAEDLTERFRAQYGRAIGDPIGDLQLIREALFDPVSREERLRRELDKYRDALGWPPPEGTPEILALPIGGDAFAITPEGRLAIAPLEAALPDEEDESVTVDELDVYAAEHTLATVYRDWTRYRLARVIGLREGQGRPMLPAAVGTVLFLLVNGNVGADLALAQPKKPLDQERLDEAVIAPIQHFAMAMDASERRSARHLQLYNGYALSEARRRLGGDVVLERDPANPGTKRVYVADGAENRVIEALARDLQGRGVAPEIVAAAFDQLTAAYEEERPRIAAFGAANSKPSRTKQLRRELLRAL